MQRQYNLTMTSQYFTSSPTPVLPATVANDFGIWYGKIRKTFPKASQRTVRILPRAWGLCHSFIGHVLWNTAYGTIARTHRPYSCSRLYKWLIRRNCGEAARNPDCRERALERVPSTPAFAKRSNQGAFRFYLCRSDNFRAFPKLPCCYYLNPSSLAIRPL